MILEEADIFKYFTVPVLKSQSDFTERATVLAKIAISPYKIYFRHLISFEYI